ASDGFDGSADLRAQRRRAVGRADGPADREHIMRMNGTLAAALVFAVGLAAQVRTTLYFGSARPKGSVSELEWQLFLRDEVTTRFPEGLTVWDAEGQWRAPKGTIEHERSKVLLLVHPDTGPARQSVQDVIDRYRKAFDQQSVLWETSR